MPITGNGNGISNINFNGVVVEEMFFNGTSVYTNARYITATGGSITTNGDFRTHTFTGSDTFTVTALGNTAGSDTLDIVAIGAGGGGRGGGRWFIQDGDIQRDTSNENGGTGGASTLSLSGTTLATGNGGGGGNSYDTRRYQSGGAPTNTNTGFTNGDSFSGGGFTGTGGIYAPVTSLNNSPVRHASVQTPGGNGTGVGSGGGGGVQYNVTAATDGGMAFATWMEGGDAGSLATQTVSPTNVNSAYTVTIGAGGSGGQNSSNINGDNSVYGTRRGGNGAAGVVSITYQFQN